MACSATERLANVVWPSYPTTESGLCCYKIVVDTPNDAQGVIDDAVAQPDYVKHSPFYSVPENKIQFYVYFREV